VSTPITGPAPNLTISKDAPATVATGATLTYTISYANTGTVDATSVVISDTVPTGTTFVSATSGGTEAGGVVTWNIGTVAVGANGSVSFTVAVTAAPGATVTNDTYSIVGEGLEPVAGSPVTTAVGAAMAEAIPTLSTWGTMIMISALLLIGFGIVRRFS
jgi:uncharacterized repeat protein (TIGR01451 family)